MALERSTVGSPYRAVRTPGRSMSNPANVAVFQSMAALGSKVSLTLANNMEAQNQRDAIHDTINDSINPDRTLHEAAYAGVVAENEALSGFREMKGRIDNGEFDDTDPEEFQELLRNQHKSVAQKWRSNPHSDIAMEKYNKTALANEGALTAGQAGKWRVTLGAKQSTALQVRINNMSSSGGYTAEDYQKEIESPSYTLVAPNDRAAAAILGATEAGIQSGSASVLQELDGLYGFSTDRTLSPMYDAAMKSVTRAMQATSEQVQYETVRAIDEAVEQGLLTDEMYPAVRDLKTAAGSPVMTPKDFAAKMVKSNIKRASNVVAAMETERYTRGVDLIDSTQSAFDKTVDAQFDKDKGAEGADVANINLGRFLVKQTKVSSKTKARFGKLGRLEPMLNNEVNPEFIQLYNDMANFEKGTTDFANGKQMFSKYLGESSAVYEMFKEALDSTVGTPEETFKAVADTLTRQRTELKDKQIRSALRTKSLGVGREIAERTVERAIPWYVPDSIWSFFQKDDPAARVQVKAAKAYQEAIDAGFSEEIARRTAERQAIAQTEMFNGELIDVGGTPMSSLMGLEGGTADEAVDSALEDPEIRGMLYDMFGETRSEAVLDFFGYDTELGTAMTPEEIRDAQKAREGSVKVLRRDKIDMRVNREEGTLELRGDRDGETFMALPLRDIGAVHNKMLHGIDEIDNLDSYYSEAYGNTAEGQKWLDKQGDLNDKFMADGIPLYEAEGAAVPSQEEYASMSAQEQTKIRKEFYKEQYEGVLGTIKQIGDFFGMKSRVNEAPSLFKMAVTKAVDSVIQGSAGDEIAGGIAEPVTQDANLTKAGSDRTRLMIQQHEGLRLKPYLDTKGLKTIGYGHLIKEGETFPEPFTKADAKELFESDYKEHAEAARKIPGFDKATPQRQSALIDLTFNMGENWHTKFPKFSKAFAEGDYKTAADELVDSEWYEQTKSRAKRIVSMMRKG